MACVEAVDYLKLAAGYRDGVLPGHWKPSIDGGGQLPLLPKVRTRVCQVRHSQRRTSECHPFEARRTDIGAKELSHGPIGHRGWDAVQSNGAYIAGTSEDDICRQAGSGSGKHGA